MITEISQELYFSLCPNSKIIGLVASISTLMCVFGFLERLERTQEKMDHMDPLQQCGQTAQKIEHFT